MVECNSSNGLVLLSKEFVKANAKVYKSVSGKAFWVMVLFLIVSRK